MPQLSPQLRAVHSLPKRAFSGLESAKVHHQHVAVHTAHVCEAHGGEDLVADPISVFEPEFVRAVEGANEIGGYSVGFRKVAIAIFGARYEEGCLAVGTRFDEGRRRSEGALGWLGGLR
jgi:hypothetical protein